MTDRVAHAVEERDALRRRFPQLPPWQPPQDRDAEEPVTSKRAPSPWREPGGETQPYPGLYVCDDRVTGSMTIGPTRMPLWALAGFLASGGWPECLRAWDDLEQEPYSWSADAAAEFLSCLFEARGEFGRLLLTLADAERLEREREERNPDTKAWWERRSDRRRVVRQLRRCLVALGEPDA